MTYRLTITAEHVRNPRSIGKFWHPLFQCMGRLLLCDVGKRVYERNGVWQVDGVSAPDDVGRNARMDSDQQIPHASCTAIPGPHSSAG